MSLEPPSEDLPLTWEELKEGMQVTTASSKELLTVIHIGLVFFKIHVMFKRPNETTVSGDGDPLDLASIHNEFLYRVKPVTQETSETSKAYDPMDEYQTKYSTEW